MVLLKFCMTSHSFKLYINLFVCCSPIPTFHVTSTWRLCHIDTVCCPSVCVSDMRPTSTSTEQCLWQTVVYGWTRFWDTIRHRLTRRPSTSQNDDALHKQPARRLIHRLPAQALTQPRTMSITRSFVACVARRWESMTKMKSIISSTFLQAMHSVQERACDYYHYFVLLLHWPKTSLIKPLYSCSGNWSTGQLADCQLADRTSRGLLSSWSRQLVD